VDQPVFAAGRAGLPAHPPILDPIRRIMPTISGIDLSPLVAILLLQVVLMFL
jgi:YggT family protein